MGTQRKLSIFQFTAVLFASSTLVAQWTQTAINATRPSARRAEMAYDTARGLTVLFGGQAPGTGFASDTWEYVGGAWAQVATVGSNPMGRRDHALAYDAVRGVTVLFGGQFAFGGNYLGDTWEFDGVGWTSVAGSGPSARSDHAMVYDSVRGVLVLFGGYDNSNLGDTWENNGNGWVQVTPATSPSARMGHAMAFDVARGRTVLFGGYDGSWQGDTWEWNGANWSQVITAQQPAVRADHAMAYDSAAGGVVVFGGGSQQKYGDTWLFDSAGQIWKLLAAINSPGQTYVHAMVSDTTASRLISFGGKNGGGGNLSTTWEFDSSQLTVATSTPYGTGCGAPPLTFSPESNPCLGGVGSAWITNAPTPLAGVALGFSNTVSFPVSLPFSLVGVGMPGCLLLQSTDIFGLPVTSVDPATLRFDLGIPVQASLAGSHVYLQAYAFAPGVNALQVIASNGIDWRLGDV